ncbi:MAG TPA: type II toxin-antitoxin system RelE/ParE family toxin [Alphaproteobacteria bacterium]|nr:type II toxin-antitoxin system RelE/ParE family toxin [Alphaproteobacteria bacterium]
MNIVQTRDFKKVVKKLHRNQKDDLDEVVRVIINKPDIGQLKTGDLAGLRVHKFKMVGQLMLLAYTWENDVITLTLIGLGSHENFYRDLKR